jgi:hypothetical protein
MKLLAALGLALVGLGAAALAGVAQPSGAHGAAAAEPAGQTITVIGTGSVTTVPNRAGFDFTVDTRAKTAAAALAQNASAARAVIAAVKGADVAGADVQTAQVSLNPVAADDGRSIVGYVASNTISVQVRDLDAAGKIVDAAVGAGATGVSGPALVRSDSDALYRQALRAAVAQARQKAEALAEAGGGSLGRVVAIAESGVAVPLPVTERGAAPTDTPIEPGTQQIDATVTVTYALG